MRLLIQFLVLLLLSVSSTLADQLSDYKLESGDLIKITVFEEPDLSLDIRLSDAGCIFRSS